MGTNRTKTDWAYQWAKRFLNNESGKDGRMGRFGMRSNDPDDIRALAALLRRAKRRGFKEATSLLKMLEL